MRLRLLACVFSVGAMLLVTPVHAYSVLTHEQLIDLTWDSSIVPLLRSRYPSLTAADLERARAYAYGGCVIQDIGYYPFGDPFFSNLTHYVRTGDFVVNLFRDAKNANELAFAVGALSHYMGDTIGHSTATNLAVPVEFPKLQAKYGNSVNYAQGEHQHVQTEFGFDIDQIAQHRFAPVHYLRHVGLQVPTQQLAMAFYQTYGLGEDFSRGRGRRVNVRGYRFAVRNFIPRIAYAVTLLHRAHEPVDAPDTDVLQLMRDVQVVAAENQWEVYRRKPGPGTYLLAGIIYILPKIGPLKLVAVKGPTPQTKAEYVKSVLATTASLNRALRRFTPPPTAANAVIAPANAERPAAAHATASPNHPLANRDLDTGNEVRPAGYSLTDKTYAALLHRLVSAPTHTVPPEVRAEILAYYSDLSLPFATKRNPEAWAEVQRDLLTLRTLPAAAEDAVFQTYDEPS